MATRRTRLIELLDRFEPVLRDAFLAAIDDIRSNAEIGRIATALERGDIEEAIRAVHLDPVAFRAFQDAIAQAFEAGGSATMGSLPAMLDGLGGKLVMRFDARNVSAERWLEAHSSQLVTRVMEDQRTAIRQALTSGMQAGTNPRTTALDIVGRIDRATGVRKGGIIGLTAQQEGFVRNALAELTLGDPASLRNYLTRSARDQRFDRSVLRAIMNGEGLPADLIARMIARYKDSLLRVRGETIARTESLASLHAAQREALLQAIERGGISEQDVRRTWRTAGDSRVRDSHAAQEAQTVGLNERYRNGLLYPGEPGAPASEVANCRCWLDVRVDFLANVR